MATLGALKEAPPGLVNSILKQNSQELKETVIKYIDTSKEFYKVVNEPQNPYFVEVENANDSMMIEWNKQGTIPVTFNKLELEPGNKWFMFTVEDVETIQKKQGNIDGVLASPKEAKDATLDWTTLNDTILYKLRNIMYDLHGSMSIIIPSKDTFNDLKIFKEKITKMTESMDDYPDNIKAYLWSVLIWVVVALVVAAKDNEANATKLLKYWEQYHDNERNTLNNALRKSKNGWRLEPEEQAIYDRHYGYAGKPMASDQNIIDFLSRLRGEITMANQQKTDYESLWSEKKILLGLEVEKWNNVDDVDKVKKALNNVMDKIAAIKENSEFKPITLKFGIDDLISILKPKNPSTGGSRRTNKKRSTRRKKKKRGKRRRSYRTKR